VVLDPQTREVTDIVVTKGFFFPEDRVIPVNMVSTTSEDRVILNQNVGDLDHLSQFEERYYVPLDTEPVDYAAPLFWYPPYGLPVNTYPPYVVDVEKNIPEGTVALKQGANVITENNQHVGDIEQVFVDNQSNKLTHFVISQGLLFKERKLIPAHWVKRTRENAVELMVGAAFLDRLPAFNG
ncbi:MAG: PRC-barrel domain-containing protein, partial [Anaerolineae bacterium]|nr:PRC-barrel domain-containing protein [Anaerolineae bacterium]